MSHDNTGALGANAWRHVAFVEQPAASTMRRRTVQRRRAAAVDLGMPSLELPGSGTGAETRTDFRWLMASDVCKHCTHAGCLDVCPTGALFRTEFGSVVVQQDICNGCGYCVSRLPVRRDRAPVRRRPRPEVHALLRPAARRPGTRLRQGLPDRLHPVRRARRAARAGGRAGGDAARARGEPSARLYGADPNDGVGGNGAFFLLLDEPEVYGLPPDPVVPTRDMVRMWGFVGAAAARLPGRGASAHSPGGVLGE